MLTQPRAINLTIVPDCGISCLAEGLYHTACSLTDQLCLCADQSYNDWVTSCVRSNCTIRDQLSTQYAAKTGCGTKPIDNWGSFMIPEIVVFGLSTLFFCLRVANRAKRMAIWGWDDTTCAVGWCFCVIFLVVGIAEVRLGAGLPTWAKANETWKIDGSLLVFFISECMYTVALGVLKSSILFLYIRIFGQSDTLRRLIWATQIFNLVLVVAFVATDFTQCQPLDLFWKQWDLEHEGKCFNVNAFAFAHSGVNIALDIWMIMLPTMQIWKLNMSIWQKAEAMSMFAVGIFLTITTCVRLTSLIDFAKDPSNIQTYQPISIWTVVELNIGVVVACMPAARVYIAKGVMDLAKATSWGARFSEKKRPSYESSNPPSFIKRRSERAPTKLQKLALRSRLGGTQFANSVNRELEEGLDPLNTGNSHVELVQAKGNLYNI